MHGEEQYNKMVVDLINKMTGPTSNGIGETPVSAVSTLTSQRNEDVEDNDGALFVQISQNNLVQATYIRNPGTLTHRNCLACTTNKS